MNPHRTAYIAALLIGGVFLLSGLGIIAAGMLDFTGRAKAPSAILFAAGLAFVFAGISVALNAISEGRRRIRLLQVSLSVAAVAALVTVAVWAVFAPGGATASASFLFWKFSL